jgi:hypothetical protein
MLAPLLGSVFALIGAGLSVAAWRQTVRQRVFLAGSLRTLGRVVGLTELPDPSSHSHASFFPRVSYPTPTGHEVIFESRLGSEQRAWSVGDVVRVRFRPDQPARAEIDSFFALWGLAALFGGLGLTFLALGIALLSGALLV